MKKEFKYVGIAVVALLGLSVCELMYNYYIKKPKKPNNDCDEEKEY